MKKIFGKEFVIGISVIVAILVLIFGIDYLKGINLFSPSNFYIASYNNVAGLELSAPVTIDGFKVGQVREIKFDYDKPGKVKVVLALNDKLRVPEDSHAAIASTLLSGGYIDIKLGKSSKMIEKGGDIPTVEGSDLMSSVSDKIMPAIGGILPKIDSLLYNLNRLVADPALTSSIQRLDGISGNLLTATDGLDKTLNKDVPLLIRNTQGVMTNVDSISANLMVLSNQLKTLPINATMDNVNEISANLSRFSAQLNNQNSTLGMLTSDSQLYDRLNQVSADIDSLLVDLKRNPKRYISIKLL